MGTFVTADPDTRIIEVTKVPVGGLSSLDVQIDIYSDLKEDLQSTPSLQGSRFPLRSFGDPKTLTRTIGPYVFISNDDGWRMLPYDIDHELTMEGNLVPEDVTIPLYSPRAGRQILVRSEESSQALTVDSGLMTEVVEGNITLQDSLKIINAMAAGMLAGADGTTVTIRDLSDILDRITATVDEFGNRSSVTLNLN